MKLKNFRGNKSRDGRLTREQTGSPDPGPARPQIPPQDLDHLAPGHAHLVLVVDLGTVRPEDEGRALGLRELHGLLEHVEGLLLALDPDPADVSLPRQGDGDLTRGLGRPAAELEVGGGRVGVQEVLPGGHGVVVVDGQAEDAAPLQGVVVEDLELDGAVV